MPITSSAKKALRQSDRRRTLNLKRKAAYKSAVKEYRSLVQSNKMDEAGTAMSKAFKNLDKAAKNKTIKKGKAGRLKSRMSQLMAKSTKASS